ncbi:MAG: thermonuclease family protein [Reyranellaceae bacterium]
MPMLTFLLASKLRLVLLAGFGVALAGGGVLATWGPREPLPGPIPAAVLRVVDGDTLAVRARIWINQELETSVRILGVDAPELNGACETERAKAKAALEFLERRTQNRLVVLHDISNDKYGGRVVARVTTESGEDLGATLLSEGLAAAYDGRGARVKWC